MSAAGGQKRQRPEAGTPGGGEEEEALLKKEITKLTKKAQTLTVINTALQQENEKLREIGGGGQGGREFNDEQVATIIRELEEDLEKLRAENLKLLVNLLGLQQL